MSHVAEPQIDRGAGRLGALASLSQRARAVFHGREVPPVGRHVDRLCALSRAEVQGATLHKLRRPFDDLAKLIWEDTVPWCETEEVHQPESEAHVRCSLRWKNAARDLRQLTQTPASMAMRNTASAAANRIGPSLPEPTAGPRGAQSTVAAALSHAIRPAPNATSASVQRFSDRDICARSRRRWRGETGARAISARRANQTMSITMPTIKATRGYAVLSMGDRSDDPAHAAIGSAQIRLVTAAAPVLPK